MSRKQVSELMKMFKKQNKMLQENSLCANEFHILRYFSLFCFEIVKLERQFSTCRTQVKSILFKLTQE